MGFLSWAGRRQEPVDEQSQVEAGGGRWWMNSSPRRLEEVDGGDEQYPVESRFVVRHTHLDQQNPVSTVGGPTEVRFLRFAVRRTPPDEQDPVLIVAGRTQGRFLRSAVRQASFPSPVLSKPVGSHVLCCLPMNTTHSVASP